VTDRGVASSDYSFGPFRLLPSRQLLLEGDRSLRLGSRALDILTTLVERAGEIVSKEELIARVWPDTFVEEGNLRVHVAAIRKILGDSRTGNRYVANIPGRGYRFVAPISIGQASAPATPQVGAVEPAHNLPVPLTRMIGRAEVIEAIVAKLPLRRFITLVGAGGIGKTTVALAVAEELIASRADGVRFVDLTPLNDPRLVPSAVASVLGVASDSPIPALISFLRNKRTLIVLDGCEHVVEATAALTSELLMGVERLHILATSREPLRADGEHVQRLSPLEFPHASAALTAAEALTFSAIQLFVERAVESSDAFELTDENAPFVAEICRRLDGIALAIELAASRVDTFGVQDLAARLDDRFRLLTRGRRTALPRHQTLSATLDWSYEFLPESERAILRRLAVLAGSFKLETACAVATGTKIADLEIVDCIANLVAKSLVVADVGRAMTRYRLLETTRAYALAKLTESGELNEAARRHSEYFQNLFQRGAAEWQTRPTSQWLEEYGCEIDNVRAALDWAFSADGDSSIGVALTVAAVPLWMHLSLMEECSGRVQRALAAIETGARRDAHREMQLYAALTASLLYTRGAVAEVGTFGTKALEIAESLDDAEYQLRSLWGLWSFHINDGQQRVALALAQRFHTLAVKRSEPNERLTGERMIGTSQYYLGDLLSARRHLEHVLASNGAPTQKWQIARFEVDQSAAARAYLARTMWLQGLPDLAMRAAESSVADARATNHAISLGLALALAACPIALLIGDFAAAEHYVDMLLDHSTKHALARWRAFGRSYQALLLMQRGDLVTGPRLLRAGFDQPGAAGSVPRFFTFRMAEALGRAGKTADGLDVIEQAIVRSEQSEERWATAELLRIKGELFLLQDMPGAAAAAEGHFRQALDWARRQGALSWELRCATSLARLWRNQARSSEARELLAPVYDRFTEGFDTADLKVAKALLDDLS
jgi:predicted ATPase/DNA-binding winged helix-turn-helix (wHTH) protein